MMKHIILSMAVLALLLANFSCQKQQPTFEEAGIIKFEEPIRLTLLNPDNPNAKVHLMGAVEGVFDEKSEQVISYTISEHILDALEISLEEFDTLLQEELNPQHLRSARPDFIAGEHANCISDCYKEHTDEDGKKKPGRGACKLGCWVDTFERVIEKVAKYVFGRE